MISRAQGFETYSGPEKASDLMWLHELRQMAQNRGSTMNWPSPQDEEYRKTDLSSVAFSKYNLADADRIPYSSSPVQFADEYVSAGLVMHNGNFVHRFGNSISVNARFLRDLTDSDKQEYFINSKKVIARADNKILLWHYENLTNGILIDIPDHVIVGHPIVIEWHVSAKEAHVVPHIALHLGRESNATIVFAILGAGDRDACVNSVLHADLEAHSNLNLVEVQNLSTSSKIFQHETITAKSDSIFNRTDVHLGSALTKSRTALDIDGKGVSADLHTLFYAIDNQHMDLKIVTHHNAANSTSKALYKGIIDDQARTVFQGMIDVAPGARQTDAYLSNKNLILSNEGRADSIPCLHIANNDVKCSHGSATGKINKEELFYLQSRGLDINEAKSLIVQGFFTEGMDRLPENIADYVRTIVANRAEKVSSTKYLEHTLK